MRLQYISLSLALLAVGALSSANTGSPDVDFDKGVDVAPVMKMIRKRAAKKNAAAPMIPEGGASPWVLHPRLRAESAIDPRDAVRLEIFGVIGPKHNILFNHLSNHQGPPQIQNLFVDPRMFDMEVELRERLKAEGTGLIGERDGMLPEASELDATDTALAQEKAEIDQNKLDLERRSADIDRQGAEHERLCLPTHPPERHQWCVDNAGRLNRIIDTFNADVRTHNARVADWRRNVDELNPAWDAFVAQIRDWEKRLEEFIEVLKREIAKPRRRCGDEEYESLKKDVKLYCKPEPRACASGQTCPELKAQRDRFLACAAARKKMNDQCFGGGNSGHREAAQNMLNGANNCLRIIIAECGSGVGATWLDTLHQLGQ